MVEQSNSTPLPPNREQMFYTRAYDEGFRDGHHAAATSVLRSLGIEIVSKEGEPQQDASQPAGVAAHPLTPPAAPPPPPSPKPQEEAVTPGVCARCGHTRESHEPLSKKVCFEKKCKCPGFTDHKTGVKIGRLRVG